jgi:hypothetical protein
MGTLTGSISPLAAVVRRKLESAVIVHYQDADEDLATSGRRVRYSIDGARKAERVLSWDRPSLATSRLSVFRIFADWHYWDCVPVRAFPYWATAAPRPSRSKKSPWCRTNESYGFTDDHRAPLRPRRLHHCSST